MGGAHWARRAAYNKKTMLVMSLNPISSQSLTVLFMSLSTHNCRLASRPPPATGSALSSVLAAASAASIAAAASAGTASVLPAVSCSSASRFVRRIALSTAAGRSARHRVRTSAARPPSELAVFAHLRREAVQRCVARGPQRGGRDTPPAGHGRPVRRATVCAACGCGPAARARSGRARPAR